MNEIVRKDASLPSTNREAQAVYNAAQEDAGFDKMLKFRKGHYYTSDGDEVPLGSQYIVHALGWTKCWLKFEGGKVAERKIYRVIRNEIPPARDELSDTDQTQWAISEITRAPQDPWVLQYLLPLETETGDVCIFVASSFGGKRAIADVCSAWARKNNRDPRCGQPIVKLREAMMPSKRFGNVPRPAFEIVGWDGVHEPVREVKAENLKDDMNDEIPF